MTTYGHLDTSNDLFPRNAEQYMQALRGVDEWCATAGAARRKCDQLEGALIAEVRLKELQINDVS